ncbi:hypothetical protein NLI96_g11145 [Meripilus lineatus]|uniref:Cell wall protein n=1 Tax=Meripilus lineatus TaxID=2056292 RepID=A0AAD5UXA0_9APHY|nr:hypothetical protein NLI96_g11145 [Physisporinus lineatus]
MPSVSSIVRVLIVASTLAPALALPFHQLPRSELSRRDVLIARKVLSALRKQPIQGSEDSGALSWQEVKQGAKTFANGVGQVASAAAPLVADGLHIAKTFLRREDLELLAREIEARQNAELDARFWNEATQIVQGVANAVHKAVPIVDEIGPFLGGLKGKGKRSSLGYDDEFVARSWDELD